MPAPQLIRVENTQPRLISLPADPKAKIPALRFVPGGSNHPASAIAALQEGKATRRGLAKGWKDHIDRQRLKVYSAEESTVLTKQPEGPGAPPSLNDRPTKAAIAIVKVTSDVEVLTMWAKKEAHRPKVREAIESRLLDLGA